MEIADLVSALRESCGDIGSIDNACSLVKGDSMFLVVKPGVDAAKWDSNYTETYGQHPSMQLFEQNADAAIESVQELIRFSKTFGNVVGRLPKFPMLDAEELLQQLQDYRASIGSYF